MLWECTGILLGWSLFSQHPQNCPVAEDWECPISGWTLFSMEDRPYFIWFVLSKEGTIGPWWLIERSVS